ncbi:helix-turn-helix domain-containing protein [Actinomadura decatromicini]|uniref:Helix-turn-helix domain-containing protein n=1 Tax=Actinomadura decatromicini TaxID=2604572 RepID=A0A5D3FYF3_9ACTN|nr:helix-turn-helix domain-containing protein [Actinomadura decatromicini]TYK53203.1 helix-turn-helix domain-containing protein [Actinomadura decatromicini]
MATVALALLDGMPLYEIGIACQIFGVDRSELTGSGWYELRLCAAEPGDVEFEFGFTVRAEHGFDALAEAEMVVVPGLPYEYVESEWTAPSGLTDALARAHRAGARIVSLCTGAFILAAAGLLDGRPATTHWMHAETLRRRHPDVRVDASVLYIDDGDVLSSAGRTAGLDLCLHIVRRDFGAEVANQVARRMVVPAHRPGGQAQYVEAPVPRTDAEGLGSVLQWAATRLDEPLTVTDLVRQARMSPRTFARRFAAHTGTSPSRWLLDQRLGRVRLLLESTDLPIDQISGRSGLGSAANLRRHFTRHVGVTPTDYRRAFRIRNGQGPPDRVV